MTPTFQFGLGHGSGASVRVHRFAALLALALATLTAVPARADMVTILSNLDTNFFDPTGGGTFTTIDTNPTNGLDIRDFTGAAPNFEHRSAVHFSLQPSLPANAVITAVTFNFQAEVVTGNVGRTVGLYGYAGSNSLTLADATAAASQLATYDNVAIGLGKHSVDLGAGGVSLLTTLVSQAKPLDLRLQGTTYGTNTLVDSIEMANNLPQFYTAPSITVTFRLAAVPEPSVMALAGMGALVVLAGSWHRRRRFLTGKTR
jgi:hypothetical protein